MPRSRMMRLTRWTTSQWDSPNTIRTPKGKIALHLYLAFQKISKRGRLGLLRASRIRRTIFPRRLIRPRESSSIPRVDSALLGPKSNLQSGTRSSRLRSRRQTQNRTEIKSNREDILATPESMLTIDRCSPPKIKILTVNSRKSWERMLVAWEETNSCK